MGPEEVRQTKSSPLQLPIARSRRIQDIPYANQVPTASDRWNEKYSIKSEDDRAIESAIKCQEDGAKACALSQVDAMPTLLTLFPGPAGASGIISEDVKNGSFGWSTVGWSGASFLGFGWLRLLRLSKSAGSSTRTLGIRHLFMTQMKPLIQSAIVHTDNWPLTNQLLRRCAGEGILDFLTTPQLETLIRKGVSRLVAGYQKETIRRNTFFGASEYISPKIRGDLPVTEESIPGMLGALESVREVASKFSCSKTQALKLLIAAADRDFHKSYITSMAGNPCRLGIEFAGDTHDFNFGPINELYRNLKNLYYALFEFGLRLW